METASIEVTIFYRHLPEEVRALRRATVPMADHIRAVSSNNINQFKMILECRYFRTGDARAMCTILLRAARHARAHLDDYFPMMREEIIRSAEELEEAVRAYWQVFQKAHHEVVPTK